MRRDRQQAYCTRVPRLSTAFLYATAAFAFFLLPVRASYTRDIWQPEAPAAAISSKLNGVACVVFGLGLNCSVSGVKDAFENSNFENIEPSMQLFESWYNQNVRPVLDAINKPVQDLQAKVISALSNPSITVGPDRDVAQEKQISLQRQYCESQGGSILFCQQSNRLPWDASSASLESRLSCPSNLTENLGFFSVPISTKESAILYPPLLNQEDDDVMLVANLTRSLLETFQRNQKNVKTVRFQRFTANDGTSLIFPAVSAKHIRPAYVGCNNQKDLRESSSFSHSSCVRQVVFVLDASAKTTYFDNYHRSEALIFRIFRLLNSYDQVQLITTSSGSQKIVLGNSNSFAPADETTYFELKSALGQVLRAGFLSLDSGISLAQDILRESVNGSPLCVKKFLIVLSSDAATLMPSTIARHTSLNGVDDAFGIQMQPYFIFLSMDSNGNSELAAKFCENKMFYRSIPPIQEYVYKGLEALNANNSESGYSDIAFGVLRYCTFIIELLIANTADPNSSNDMNQVIWSPPFYDPTAATGSLIFTTSMQVYTNTSGIFRFRGTVEVDHVFFSYPSLRDKKLSQGDTSIVAIFDKFPAFLGHKVDVALTALHSGMSFVDRNFINQLNALMLPLQSRFYLTSCNNRDPSYEVFNKFNTSRAASSLATKLRWPELKNFDSGIFIDKILKSPTLSGFFDYTQSSLSKDTLYFRHAEFSSLVFLRKIPIMKGKLAIPSSTTASYNCSQGSAACRSATDGLLFLSNASKQAGFVFSRYSFVCPMCAQDAALSETEFRDISFLSLHHFASGSSTANINEDLNLLPSAIGELNILASLRQLLEPYASANSDILGVSVTGMNGVSFYVNNVVDANMRSSALIDYSHLNWFTDAALHPSILHVSYDSSDPKNFSFILSFGVVAKPQGIPWVSSHFDTLGIAAIAHLRIKASWFATQFTTALLDRDSRHICLSTTGICSILNYRGYILANAPENRTNYRHIQIVYPVLAQALLQKKVFNQVWTRPFAFSVDSELTVNIKNDVGESWLINNDGPSKFHIYIEDSLYSVNIAKLPGIACILLIVIPHHSLNSKAFERQIPPLFQAKSTTDVRSPSFFPRIKVNSADMKRHSIDLSRITQQYYCQPSVPSWLVGVSISVAVTVLFLVALSALIRYRVFQQLEAYFFQRKSTVLSTSTAQKSHSEFSRYEFKLCSPDDFVVQTSILRCVSIFHKAFSNLESQIVNLNTFSLSKRIIADDIDGQRLKIQNYLEVLIKQRTLLHERIVSRMLLCASMRLRASAYADIVEVLAEHAAQYEVVAKHIELVRDQLQEKCDAL